MPLSFVAFGVASSLAIISTEKSEPLRHNYFFHDSAIFLFFINVIILVLGIYLAITHQPEAPIITFTSLLSGATAVILYAIVKYKWVRSKIDDDQTIYPQLY